MDILFSNASIKIFNGMHTKDWLAEALIELLKDNPNSEILVTQLTQKAGVCRSSFYQYFDSKDDIITYFFDDVLENTFSISNSHKYREKKKIYEILFEQIFQRRAAIRIITEAGKEHLLSTSMKKIKSKFLQALEFDVKPSPCQRNYVSFSCSEFDIIRGISLSWIEDGIKTSPQTLSADISTLNLSCIESTKADRFLLVK